MRRGTTLWHGRSITNVCRRTAPLMMMRCSWSSTSSFRCATPSNTNLYASLRYCSSTTTTSAVDVENFVLRDEVVQRDMAALERWNAISERIEAARTAQDYAAILATVHDGLVLLEELGANNAPIQCEGLLCMEAAQAHLNLAAFADSIAYAQRAKRFLLTAKEEHRDHAQVAEIKHFIANVMCQQGNATEARTLLEEVLRWIDVDAKSAMPMQAVAATNLRRPVISTLGECITAEARVLAEAGKMEEAKELYARALDLLIEALNGHIDAEDVELVKRTLEHLLFCFEGVGDVAQALTTCRKYSSWCSRHDDAAGVEHGKVLLRGLCERHQMDPATAMDD